MSNSSHKSPEQKHQQQVQRPHEVPVTPQIEDIERDTRPQSVLSQKLAGADTAETPQGRLTAQLRGSSPSSPQQVLMKKIDGISPPSPQQALTEKINGASPPSPQQALIQKLEGTSSPGPQQALIEKLDTGIGKKDTVAQARDGESSASSPKVPGEGQGSGGGLPSQLRTGLEHLSGLSMNGVKVHRNSSSPASIGAHSYAQGNDIHLGPGREQDLPHEAWHVVQQRQGRVPVTKQAKGTAINDDAVLEKEADVMGGKAAQMKINPSQEQKTVAAQGRQGAIVQRQQQQPAVAASQIQLSHSVGIGGDNLPADVLLLQQRLQQMGYLSPADFTAEQVQVTQSAQAVDMALIPRTVEALGRFSEAAYGRPSLLISPGQAALGMLNAPMQTALGAVDIGQAVGRSAPNQRADVQSVQDRLHAIQVLSANHYQRETVASQTNAPTVADTAMPETINAIAGFNLGAVGMTFWQIRPDSREEELLNNPPRFQESTLTLSAGVGAGQSNSPAEVKSVQDRLLALGHLTQQNYTAEMIDPANASNPTQIPDAQLTHTIAGIRSFQATMGLTSDGQVLNGSETQRLLIRPNLPTARSNALTGAVGVGPRRGTLNQPSDVLMVQNRLHELGFLSTSDYMSELADSSAQNQLQPNQIPQTIAAIRSFQQVVVGVSDGTIDAGGKTARTLNDPTYGTTTSFNPLAADASAGVAFGGGNQGQALNRLIRAIERHEAGGRTGEAPADLVNAAGVPASYGSAQMIGGTALGLMRQNGSQQLRDHYGLDRATLNTVSDRGTNAADYYNQIYGQVPAGGESETNLQNRISTYTQQNGAQFRTDTGLSNGDITRMFRFAQIRRRILAAAGGGSTAPRNLNTIVSNLLNNQDFAASYNALGLNRSSLRAYVRNRRSMGENRQGFVTKAIFSHPESQKIRNAMTDANGRSIGRMSIQEVYNTANGRVPARTNNRDRVVAARAARGHNSGASRINDSLATIMADPYVHDVLTIWDTL